MMLIEPGNHLRSDLWRKVWGTHGIAGGLRQPMPAANPRNDEDIARLGERIDLNTPN